MRSLLASLTLCLLVTSSAAAQGDPDPLWIDVNVGGAIAAEDGHTTAIDLPFRFETASFSADYQRPAGAFFNVGIGYMFHPRVGFGVNLTGTAHMSPATISVSIPHPQVFGRAATDVEDTDRDLLWAEGSVNLHAMVRLTPVQSRLVARVFGGPSYFSVTQESVSDFGFTESLNLATGAYAIELDEFEYEDAEGSAWGFHLGGDVSYFFNNHVGIGGIVQFTRGRVDLEDPALEQIDETGEVKVGGVQIGAGLRLKF